MLPLPHRVALICALVLVVGVRAGPGPPLESQEVAPASASEARAFHVASNGLPDNDGSPERPLDLATALSGGSPARPGDTIWLRAGTYRGSFVSTLKGTEQAPITVRQFPGERATLDGAGNIDEVLTVYGAWTIYWGFEVTNSSPNRVVDTPGSTPPDGRGGGLNVQGAHTRFVNLIVHDTAQGFGFWLPAEDAELYGNLVYYNGWDAPDRGHGHAIYAQNRTGTKRIVDNILFNQFSHGLHIYGSSNAWLDNFHVEGNVAFNNGGLAASGVTRNVLIGGGRVADNLTLDANATYFPGTDGQNNLGYDAGCSHVVITNNQMTGGSPLTLVNCTDVVMHGNTLYGRIAEALPRDFPQNTYLATRPAGTTVIVRPNVYEAGRAHIVVYNWDKRSEVTVDVSPVAVADGTKYEIRDAQDYFGAPVASGVLGEPPVTIPMTGLRPAPPVGEVPRAPIHTAPEFGVFVFQALLPPSPPSNLRVVK